MFRFDQLISRGMIVRDVKQKFPATLQVFDDLGFRPSCDDCDLETIARKHGLSSMDLVDRLNQAAFGSKADTLDNGSTKIS